MSSIFLLSLALPLEGQTLYTEDGESTPRAEEVRWLLNRGRFNPALENGLRGPNYSGLSPKPPLAPHFRLNAAARNHSQDMAVKNVFQHQTVTGSAFYNWQAHHNNSTPDFIERITDEGYARSGGAENINAGFPTALASYLSWWNSTDHRSNMYDVGNATADKIRREIGYGYFFSAPATYDHYDTMVISRRTAFPGFFTDTIFRDANSNSAYNEGEGIAGIRIDLKNNAIDHGSYDVSTSSGNFAIPLTGINAGNTVQVYLTNNTSSTLVLSIPTNFQNLNTLQLNPGQKWLWGSFTRATEANAGFRNLTLSATQPLVVPAVSISTASGQPVLSWQSQPGFTYQVQWSANLQPPWNNLNSAQTGTGGVLSTTDPARVTSTKARFYRLLISGP